mgnify:CR=1 FL=1
MTEATGLLDLIRDLMSMPSPACGTCKAPIGGWYAKLKHDPEFMQDVIVASIKLQPCGHEIRQVVDRGPMS